MLQSQERVAGLFVDDIRKRQAEMLEAYRKKEAAKKAGEKDR